MSVRLIRIVIHLITIYTLLLDGGQGSGSSLAGLDFSGIQVPHGSSGGGRSARDDTAMIRDMLVANPDQLSILQQNNPALAEGIVKHFIFPLSLFKYDIAIFSYALRFIR